MLLLAEHGRAAAACDAARSPPSSPLPPPLDLLPPICNRQVESQRADPLPSAVEARASLLMRHINSTAGEGDLYNNQFLTKLSHIRFVPVHTPPPPRRPEEDDGIFVSGSEDGGVGRGGRAARRVEGWSEGVVLTRFDEAAVPKDRNLVFTAFPVHVSGLVPPQVRFGGLDSRILGDGCVSVRVGRRRSAREGSEPVPTCSSSFRAVFLRLV